MSKTTKLQDLVVLGLLNEKPRYGYEIKTIIDHVMSHIIDVSSGSLYYTLKKLREQNLVEESATEKVGRRPERSIYQITAEGKRLFEVELPGVIFPHARPFFPLDMALYFFQFIDDKSKVRRLKMRLEYLKMVVGYIDENEKRYTGSAPLSHLFILHHHRHYNRMEQEFHERLLKELVKGNSYTLDERDMAEVQHEYEAFQNRVRYDTVLPELG